jgi:hypothetical protein
MVYSVLQKLPSFGWVAGLIGLTGLQRNDMNNWNGRDMDGWAQDGRDGGVVIPYHTVHAEANRRKNLKPLLVKTQLIITKLRLHHGKSVSCLFLSTHFQITINSI